MLGRLTSSPVMLHDVGTAGHMPGQQLLPTLACSGGGDDPPQLTQSIVTASAASAAAMTMAQGTPPTRARAAILPHGKL